MEAKKCDRCGKLYEESNYHDDVVARVRFRYSPISSIDRDIYNEKEIARKQTKRAYIKADGSDVDLCPACLESFRCWFEYVPDGVVMHDLNEKMADSPVRPLKKEE